MMVKMGLRRLALVALLASLVIGTVWAGGCTTSDETGAPTQETPTQTFVEVTPQEASVLIQDNEGNMDFVILDIRTPEEFAEGHIAGAIMIDFYSMSFRMDLDKLDKDKTYLLYCRSGNRSGQTLPIMEELGFQEVYHLMDGINAWKAAMLPTAMASIIEDITPQEAFALIQENEGNMNFVIIDVRTPEEFGSGHIENAVNIDFNSMSFRNDIDKLDKDKTYIVYCRTGLLSGQALDIMEELGFNEVYKPSGGIEAWTDAGLPVTGGNGQEANGGGSMM